MTLAITAAYTGAIALFFVLLSIRVIRTRRAIGVGLGDGGNRVLMRHIRGHANFAEYVPLALILMWFAEFQGAPAWAINFIGFILLAGRAIHAYGLSQEPEQAGFRVIGMTLTFTALIAGALANLGLASWTFFGQA